MQFKFALSALALAIALPAFAQTPAPAAPPPAWKQGMDNTAQPATLHPFAPIMTGTEAKDIQLSKLKVAPGFKVEVWTDGIPTARSMANGDKGTVFVGNRVGKNVAAITEKDGKRSVKIILKGLDTPNGIVYSMGTLFVAERTKITRYDNIEANLDNPGAGKLVVGGLDPTNF